MGWKSWMKKKLRKCNILSTVMKAVGIIVIEATTPNSVMLSVTGVGIVLIPISSGKGDELKFSYWIFYETKMNEFDRYKNITREYSKLLPVLTNCLEDVWKIMRLKIANMNHFVFFLQKMLVKNNDPFSKFLH